ncbi:MAG: hypothetical protein WC683_15660 [bacterium]
MTATTKQERCSHEQDRQTLLGYLLEQTSSSRRYYRSTDLADATGISSGSIGQYLRELRKTSAELDISIWSRSGTRQVWLIGRKERARA